MTVTGSPSPTTTHTSNPITLICHWHIRYVTC
jgi:hypothetical protein